MNNDFKKTLKYNVLLFINWLNNIKTLKTDTVDYELEYKKIKEKVEKYNDAEEFADNEMVFIWSWWMRYLLNKAENERVVYKDCIDIYDYASRVLYEDFIDLYNNVKNK
jgi:hypothetical protein